MTTVHPCKPVLLLGALSVSLAAPAPRAEGQPRSAPERPLSAAIAEALGSPFHGDRLLTQSGGHGLLASSAASLPGSPTHVGPAPPPAPVPPSAQAGAGADRPSQGKVFVLAAITSLASGMGVIHWYERCDPPIVTLHNSGDVREWVEDNVICPDKDIMNVVGPLVVITTTAGASKLAGNGFVSSLAGSALGFAGGVLMAFGAGNSLEPPNWVLGGVIILTHAWMTMLIAD